MTIIQITNKQSLLLHEHSCKDGLFGALHHEQPSTSFSTFWIQKTSCKLLSRNDELQFASQPYVHFPPFIRPSLQEPYMSVYLIYQSNQSRLGCSGDGKETMKPVCRRYAKNAIFPIALLASKTYCSPTTNISFFLWK